VARPAPRPTTTAPTTQSTNNPARTAPVTNSTPNHDHKMVLHVLAMARRDLLLVAVLIAGLHLASHGAEGCPTAPAAAAICPCIGRQSTRVIVITHGALQVDGTHDSFWSVVHEGIADAGSNLGVEVEHRAPTSKMYMDMTESAIFDQLVDQAILDRPDGVVLSLPSVSAVSGALARLAANNITVFSINSGYNQVQTIPFAIRPVLHIGQDEATAGQDLAQALYAAGKRTAACINDEASNQAKATRCSSFNTKFQALGGSYLGASAPGALQNVESAYHLSKATAHVSPSLSALVESTNVDVIVSLAADVAIQVRAVVDAGTAAAQARVDVATFDVDSPQNAIESMLTSGKVLMAVDQQPYLQGFLPILFMTTFKTALMKAENTRLKTGPKILNGPRPAAPFASMLPRMSDVLIKAQTHGNGGGGDAGFWDEVYLGSVQAAADMGVSLDLTDMCTPGPDSSAALMKQYIEDTLALPAATRPAGILVSIPDSTVLGPPLLAAQAAGVAVVSLNSGYDAAGKADASGVLQCPAGSGTPPCVPALTHVGMTEFEAGKMAGEYFINRGHQHGLCVNHENTNSAIIQRCQGFRQAFVDSFPAQASSPHCDARQTSCTSSRFTNIDIALANGLTTNRDAIVPVLTGTASIDCILIGGQSVKGAVVAAIAAVPSRTIKAGTFDYNAEVGTHLLADELEFGIHQQQYYQGYVPVVLLTLYQTRGLALDEPILFTGPAFITKDTVVPRQCELAPVCDVSSCTLDVNKNRPDCKLQTQLVLRATIGTNTISMEFAPANFGLPMSNLSTVFLSGGWAPKTISLASAAATSGRRLQAGQASDGCTPLATATTLGSAVLVEEGGCLFTTKANNAQAAGYGMLIVARKTTDIPVMMQGEDPTNSITIPAILLSKAHSDNLRNNIAAAMLRVTPYSITCMPGSRLVNYQCQPCPEGTYQNNQGADTCIPCPAGTASKTIGATALSQCMPCPVGTFQDLTSQQACKVCSDTGYSPTVGATKCATCPANNHTGVLVVVARTCGFSLGTGVPSSSKVMDKCDPNVVKTSTDDCFCTEGHYGVPGGQCTECPEGASCCSCPELYSADGYALETIFQNFATYDRPCSSCMYGAQEKGIAPIANPGFFAAVAKPNTFLPCQPADACRGGPESTCARGYDKLRCGQCADGFFRDGGTCSECPDTPEWLVILAGTLMMLFCLYALNAVSRWFRSGALSIALDWAQTISIIFGFALEWPRKLHTLSTVLSLMMFNTEYFAPECSFKSSYWGKWGVMLMLPFFTTGCFIAIYGILRTRYKYCCKSSGDPDKPAWSAAHAAAVENAFINAYFMFLSVFHPFLAKNALEIFRCRQYADDKFYLDVEPSLECYTDEWYAHMPFAILAFMIYGIGIPVLFWAVLHRGRQAERLDDRAFKRRYGSIFIVYKKECYFWEVWIKTKKVLVCVAMNVFPEETTYQGILAFVIIEVAIHLNMKHQPFRFKPNNRVQKVASLNTLAVIFCGLLFYSGKLDGWSIDVLIYSLFGWCVFTMVFLVRSFIIEFISYYGHWVLRKHPSWAPFLQGSCGELVFHSRTNLANSHWASTEDLLDRYLKQKKAQSKQIEMVEGAPPQPRPDFFEGSGNNSHTKDDEQRPRSIVTVGDIGRE
jgi:simple sugar transport system substrate-binding protein